MPTIQPQANASGASQRGTFRPPWVKEGPPALPMPSSAPWMRARDTRSSRDDGQTTAVSQELQQARDRLNAVEPTPTASSKPSEAAPIRRLSKITIVPATPAENGRQPVKREVHSKPTAAEPEPPKSKAEPPKPKAEEQGTKPKQTAAASKEKTQDGATKATGAREKRIPVETAKARDEPPKEKPKTTVAATKEKSKTPAESVKEKEKPKPKTPAEPAQEKTEPAVVKRVRAQEAAKPPPPPPAPPAPPPPPPPAALILPDYKPPTLAKVEKIEALKSRPRKRPDWGTMMKEIESARKLNHVVCNDRSSPLLATPIKVKEQFMYESEKPNVHNRLLDQIQSGVQLKRVKTNDRSRPILDGLRKFRRQMTIEEQSQKDAESAPTEQDELDDIDKVRDDLQSTKQMLALELRNKEAMERENKKLMARLLNLEVELEKERAAKQQEENPQSQRLEEEKETRKLKTELTEVQKVAEEMENKYHETAGQLELTRGELEDMQRKNQIMERRLANYASRDSDMPLMKQMSSKKLAAAKSNSKVDMAHQAAGAEEEEEEESEYEEETETESEEDSSDEENKEALQEKRLARELKLLSTKLKSFKDKEETARKERISLRDQLKKLTAMLKEEKKKYKVIQKEVDSMASVLKEDEEEESDEEEEEESESESESESEASDEESDGDLPPDRSSADKKQNLTVRSKRHETALNVLKKGNYMLKANVDRIKDDLFKQKEMAITLQEDLNAVLAELG